MRAPQYDGGSLENLVAAVDESVKTTLSSGRGLREFLASVDKLEEQELRLIVEQALKLLEGFYVHLPMKRAMHAVEPLQRLRLLRRRISQFGSEIAFHHEMTETFTSLRDLHTAYILPAHFSEMVAVLPFRIACCDDAQARRYILAEVMPGFSHSTFVPGVEITYWNGIPVDRAVEIVANHHAGSNPAARHARGVDGLSKRAMNVSPPPDEEWVVVGYNDLGGQPSEFRAEWTVTGLPPERDVAAPSLSTEVAASFGLDLEGDTFRRINKMLFAQHVNAEQRRIESVRRDAREKFASSQLAFGASENGSDAVTVEAEAASAAVTGMQSTAPEIFNASVLEIAGRKIGYLRIRTFKTNNDTTFVNEALRLIELPEMPKDGLIIDVRGNSGGLIPASERLLQLFTHNTIEPCRLQFVNTPATLELCQSVPSMLNWRPSMSRAFETGAAFSAAFPITPPDRCNDIGQRYYGPVVLITDARSYSATDIFAAGFQDHKIGTVLGIDDSTGAGGANVWTLEQIREFFQSGGVAPPLDSLPRGTGMRVAIRRTLRVGDEAGTELEDLGVKPDVRHRTTRDDILNDDVDLKSRAAAIIVQETQSPPVRFGVTAARTGNSVQFNISSAGVDYVDTLIEQRHCGSRKVVAGQLFFNLPMQGGLFDLPPSPALMELRGYSPAGRVVCVRRFKA